MKPFTTYSAFLLLAGSSIAFGQGALAPSAAPAPSMKTLDELYERVDDGITATENVQDEARTAITSLPYTISTSGSYYLADSLTTTDGTGITITASLVTLDLNGFSLSGGAGSSADGGGVYVMGASASPLSSVVIKNGHITGFSRSVHVQYAVQTVVSDLVCRESGREGLLLENVEDSHVKNCNISESGDDAVAINDGGGDLVENCVVANAGDESFTFYKGEGSTLKECVAYNSVGRAVWFREAQKSQCVGVLTYDSTDAGIRISGTSASAVADSRVVDCLVRGAVLDGVVFNQVEDSRVESNHVTETAPSGSGFSYGVDVTGSASDDNLILKNSCIGHNDNFRPTSTDIDAPEVTTAGELSTSGANVHPWANFSL